MKRVLALLFAVLTVMLLCIVPAAASTRAADSTTTLTFDGATANCSFKITKLGKQINAILQLWQGNTLLDSWSGSKVSVLSLSGTHSVVHGQIYTLQVICTVDGASYYVAPVSRTA